MTDHPLGEKNFSPSAVHPWIVFVTVKVVRGVKRLVLQHDTEELLHLLPKNVIAVSLLI